MQLSLNSLGILPASFISPREINPGLTLVTGPRGAGKTRWCMSLADYVRNLGLDLRGLVSPAVIEGKIKSGIDLLDLESGERRHLAYRKGDSGGDISTSDWQMVVETLRWGNTLLEQIQTCDFFILDEVGPLEFEFDIGLSAGLDFVDKHKETPSFVVVRPTLLSVARQRWPWAEILDIFAEGGV